MQCRCTTNGRIAIDNVQENMGKGCICKSRVEVRKLKEGITGKYALGGIKLSFRTFLDASSKGSSVATSMALEAIVMKGCKANIFWVTMYYHCAFYYHQIFCFFILCLAPCFG